MLRIHHSFQSQRGLQWSMCDLVTRSRPDPDPFMFLGLGCGFTLTVICPMILCRSTNNHLTHLFPEGLRPYPYPTCLHSRKLINGRSCLGSSLPFREPLNESSCANARKSLPPKVLHPIKGLEHCTGIRPSPSCLFHHRHLKPPAKNSNSEVTSGGFDVLSRRRHQ